MCFGEIRICFEPVQKKMGNLKDCSVGTGGGSFVVGVTREKAKE